MLVNSRSFTLFEAAIKSPQTKQIYKYSLHEFMKFANIKEYDDIVKLGQEKLQKILENWIIHLSKKGLKALTIRGKLSPVDLFLDMNKVDYHKRVIRRLIPSDDYVPGGDKPFTTEEIKKMLAATTKLRTKAVIHFFASTGIRPAGIVDPVLRLKHIEKMPFECKSVKIYDGSRLGYFVFLTPEASKALDNYLFSRKINGEELSPESPVFANYINKKSIRKNDFISARAVRQIMVKVLQAAGIERVKQGKRFDKAAVYGFRKRFNTVLKLNNDVNSNIAEKLMSHKRGLDGSYLKPTRDECFKEFVKATLKLSISDEARDKIKIAKLEQEKSEVEDLKSKVDELVKLREKEDLVSANLVSFYETGDDNYIKNFPPEYFEYWRMWKALKASGKKIKEFSWPVDTIPDEIKELLESN